MRVANKKGDTNIEKYFMGQSSIYPKVCILLSTYNGSAYLNEQIESLLSQKDVDLHIVIRDDGSSDDTLQILEGYKEKYCQFSIYAEKNIGAEASFYRLCEIGKNLNFEYYAFCDQDDVWDNDKLKNAIEILSKFPANSPNLYFSNLKMVDERLNFIRNFYTDEVSIEREKTLVQIFTYGCTCVFNKNAIRLYCKCPNVRIPHDNWIYVICSYFGNVFYDNIPKISYRQHSNNLSGHRHIGLLLLWERLLRLKRNSLIPRMQVVANQLLKGYSELLNIKDKRDVIKIATYKASLKNRIKLIFDRSYMGNSLMKNVAIRLRILLGKL